MRNLAFAVLLGTSALAAPALAQTSDMKPAPAPATNDAAPAATGAATMGGDFVTKREANQFLASNIRGANVMGPQNESIGTVSDMIVGDDGRLAAITVDVGGFLGIGAKTVAIPATGLKYVPVAATASGDMANNSAMAPAGTAAPASGGAGTATTADPAVTGSTTADNAAGGSTTGGAMPSANATAAASDDGSRLDHIMVNFTRDQLQNAPEFND